jgi:ABC-type sugar transport system ATPase subunit
MSLIEVKNLIKTYKMGDESFNALDDVSLSIEKGEFVAIMGASGSGKSTLMNTLGTLDKPNSGSYMLDGIDVFSLNPDKLSEIRNIKLGFVFQGFNLISRTSAIDNVQMPMIYKGIPEEERIERAKWALKIVGLENREDHMPNQMSGGQQQRVAVARALVMQPDVLLLDEPLSNLDAKLRSSTRREILMLHKRLDATMIYVTHDQTEALTLADRIVCMSMGHVQQIGTPIELYDSPANLFVAGFIGLPPMNLYDVLIKDGTASCDDFMTPLTAEDCWQLMQYEGKVVTMGVRPENVVPGGTITVNVMQNENLGQNTLVSGTVGRQKITCKFRDWCTYQTGDQVRVSFQKKHFFDKQTTKAIRR